MPSTHRLAVFLLCSALTSACGGGGGGTPPAVRSGSFCNVGLIEAVGRPFGDLPNGALLVVDMDCSSLPKPLALDAPRLEDLLVLAITGATVEYYPVTGATLQEACQNIFSTSGPVVEGRRHAGSAELGYTPGWSAPNPPVGGMIGVHIDSIDWEVTVRLPQWTPPPGTSQADIDAWNNFVSELERHEQGHVDRYNNGMQAVRTAMVCTTIQVAATATDDQIDAAVKAACRASAAYMAMEQSQQDYETATNHGTTGGQNATWTP